MQFYIRKILFEYFTNMNKLPKSNLKYTYLGFYSILLNNTLIFNGYNDSIKLEKYALFKTSRISIQYLV